ncbi:Dyp-type peroxidase [Sagittula sp. S175]|uniref:Dyp-type peroxidase n=1 Tax=Sagittula sp. S175 TaxID=3415129 RepID=UPI003C7DB9FB
MSYRLDLDDIQGNVARAYGRYSYPFARYMFFNISHAAKGRAFVNDLLPYVTTAARWPKPEDKPPCTLNVGFTFMGLYRLQLSNRVLQGMPEEFIAGMKDRAFLLGDRDQTVPESALGKWDKHWDQIWQDNRCIDNDHDVHVWISLNAQRKLSADNSHKDLNPKDPLLKVVEPVDDLARMTQTLRDLCDSNGGVRLIEGNGASGTDPWHDAQAVFDQIDGLWLPTPREHFGFTDGIGDPVFAGQLPAKEERERVVGRGKRMGSKDNGGWQPLNPGEFILGHPDEAQELPPSAHPPEFMRNGSFMAYRKLHENVATFRRTVSDEAARYARVQGISQEEADVTLRAKMVGRWPDGIPLAAAPTHAKWMDMRKAEGFEADTAMARFAAQIAYLDKPEAANFRYANDMQGYKTPLGAHMRRVNTRDYLDPLNATDAKADNPEATTALNKRRRIMRRGLPYGTLPADQQTDETEQGVTMMILCASLFRQFEFIQQQWIQYGLDFHQGNDTCPLLGNHEHHKRMAIPADPASGTCPYTMSRLDTVVECRGGDYFFIPSITALRAIAMGVVDPT